MSHPGQENHLSFTNNSLKDQHKKVASTIKTAHILSIISKCKFSDESKQQNAKKEINKCLLRFDETPETSLLIQALKFSDHLTIVFDLNESSLKRLANSDLLGWYSQEDMEVLIGAKGLLSNNESERNQFFGTFAHELAHWCMGLVFKNQSRPYYSDPKQEKEREFKEIVQGTYKEIIRMKNANGGKGFQIHSDIDNVFSKYETDDWHAELIVRVPHLIAVHGIDTAEDILSRHEPTKRLLNYYQTYSLDEIKKFIAEGDLEGSRKTIYRYNQELGLLRSYQEGNWEFSSDEYIDSQEPTSLVVYSSRHPYLSFMRIAWTMNCRKPTNRFYDNNLFFDCDASVKNPGEALKYFWESSECETLFAICKNTDALEMYNSLLRDVLNNSKLEKRVMLFITNSLTELTKKRLAAILTVKYVSCGKVGIQDLAESSRQKVLDSSITFLGEKIKVEDFLGEDNEDLIDGCFIERLMRNEDIVVHRRVDSIDDLPPGFVSFFSHIELSIQRMIDLIQESSTDRSRVSVIIVGEQTNYPEQLKSKLCEVMNTDTIDGSMIKSADEFRKMAQICSRRNNILLLLPSAVSEYSQYNNLLEHTKCRYFLHIRSEGTIYCDLIYHPDLVFSRRLCMKEDEEDRKKDMRTGVGCQMVKEENIQTQIESGQFIQMLKTNRNQMIVLSDISGSGKSQLLSFIDHSLTDCWVVKIALKTISSLIDKHAFRNDWNMESAMGFLLESGQINDEFAVKVFSRKMLKMSKYPIILLLDGLDEMNSSEKNYTTNKKKIAKLLMYLKESTCVKTLITTRPDSESYLRDLSCPVYKLKPLLKEDALKYIKNSCQARIKLLPESEMTYDIAEHSYSPLNCLQYTDLLEIPLHVSMLSDMHFESIWNGKPMSAPSNSDFRLETFYTEFINMKYRIYSREKIHSSLYPRLNKCFDPVFQKLALFTLYGNEKFCELSFSNNEMFRLDSSGSINLEDKEVEQYLDIGIICRLSSTKIDFVHKTYAEYFVSQLFISWAQQKSLSPKFIGEVVYNPSRTNSFFEYFLGSALFSEDILKAHGDAMVRFGRERTLNVLDEHVKLDQWTIVNHILKCWRFMGKVKVLIIQALFFRKKPSAFSWYIKFLARITDGGLPKAIDSHKCLLSTNNTIEVHKLSEIQVKMILQILKTKIMGPFLVKKKRLFLRAFERGNEELLKDLIQILGRSVILSNEGRNLIHLTAASGNLNLVKWLMSEGASISSLTARGVSTVTFARRRGKLEMAKWLKEQGVSVGECSTGVHFAGTLQQYPAIQWLTEEGLDTNAAADKGLTRLHLPVIFNLLLRTVKYLFELGADVRAWSEEGWTALFYMVCRCKDLYVIEWLAEQGSRVDGTTEDARTALHILLPYYNSLLFDLTCIDLTMGQTFSENLNIMHYDLEPIILNGFKFRLRVLGNHCDLRLRDKVGRTVMHILMETPMLWDYDNWWKDLLVLLKKIAKSNPELLQELSSYLKENIKAKAPKSYYQIWKTTLDCAQRDNSLLEGYSFETLQMWERTAFENRGLLVNYEFVLALASRLSYQCLKNRTKH